MATIRTAIQIADQMTGPLRSITNALNITVSSFEQMQRISSRAVDTQSLQAARAELTRAATEFNRIEEEIRQADQAQQKFNSDVRNGRGAAAGLLGSFRNFAVSMGLVFGVKEIIEASDEMASMGARLDLMNDGLQNTIQLQDMIFQSAQRARSPYLDTSRVISKLGILAGDAFSSSKEIVAFAEQMNKQFKIGGSSITEQTAAMYQLTQAMASGRLQGDEFRSIRENAPLLAKAIEDYMKSSGVKGTMKDWSADGLITADVIKKAMFAMTDEVNERFEKLPMTWGQVWTIMVNDVLYYSQPLLDFINLLANNWGMVAPVLLIIADALAVYAVAAYGGAAATTALTAARTFAVPIIALFTGATMADTAAQWELNAALYACPIVWIIAAVIAVIAIIYLAVAAVNKFAEKTYSATGFIVGVIHGAGAFIGNIFIAAANLIGDIVATLVNVFATFGEFIANVFNDPVGSIIRLFAGMASIVLQIIQSIASAIDTVFGSNLADTVGGWNNSLQGKVDHLVGEPKIKVDRLDSSAWHFDRFEIGKAYHAGYQWGSDIADKVSVWDDLKNSSASTAANTGAMKDALKATDEDLKYLRDLAEREVIDRTVLRDVKVNLNNTFGDIRETADIDGIINKIEGRLADAIANEAEGDFSV